MMRERCTLAETSLRGLKNLADDDDHELSGLQRCELDHSDEGPLVDVVLRRRRRGPLDEARLPGGILLKPPDERARRWGGCRSRYGVGGDPVVT